MTSKNTKKIILYLLKNTELININQIARTLKISVGGAFKILLELENNKIVSSKVMGNAKFYSLNLKNDETLKSCELLLLEEKRNLEGYARVYAEEIRKFEGAKMIILFGSILNNKEFSDVDVLFVTNKIKEVTNFCLSLHKVRTKPVVPLILRKNDLIKEIKNKKEAIIDIIKTGVVIRGEDVFLEVIRDAKY